MKVLVTGGAGFIGSHIVDMLLQDGHSVAVVDNLSRGFLENLNPYARFYNVDIRSPKLAEVFAQERPEVVSHQAAWANVRESFLKPVEYADINIIGSLNLLECCRQYSVRKIIYASTGGAAYGEPHYVPVDELHPMEPLDPYGASKHNVEHYLYLYRVNYGLDFTILRYPNVYGPRQDPHGEAGVVSIFVDRLLHGEALTINGSGEQQRDFVYVTDIARANLLALTQGDGAIYNLGSNLGTSVNEIAVRLAELADRYVPIVHGPAKAGEVQRIYLDARKVGQELGWQPRVDLADGLARTLAYFRAMASNATQYDGQGDGSANGVSAQLG